MIIRNSTIADNSASGTTLGGGVYVTGDSDAKGTHTILTNNIMVDNMSASVENNAVLSKTDKTSYCLFGLSEEMVGAEADGEGFTFDRPEGRSATFFKVIGVRRFDAAKDAAKE